MIDPQPGQVRAIITTSLTDDVIAALIQTARGIADECIRALPPALQVQILTWLTAHLIASMTMSAGGGKQLKSWSTGDASESYAIGTLGDMLKGTTYGQMVAMLDPNGCLLRRGKMAPTWEVL